MNDFHDRHMQEQLGLGGEFRLPSPPEMQPLDNNTDRTPAVIPDKRDELRSISSLDLPPETVEMIRRNREAAGEAVPSSYSTETDFELYVRGQDDRILFHGDFPSSVQQHLIATVFGHSTHVGNVPQAKHPVTRLPVTKTPMQTNRSIMPKSEVSYAPLVGTVLNKIPGPTFKIAAMAVNKLKKREVTASRRISFVGFVASVGVVMSVGWGVGTSVEAGIPPHLDKSEAFSNSFDLFKLVGKILP